MFTDREMDKEDVVHIYNGILLSHKKLRPFAAIWMDLGIIKLKRLSKWSKTEKGKYHMTSLTCGI